MPDIDHAAAQAGDRAPPCYGMSPGRVFYSSEEQYGRPCVLILIGSQAAPSSLVTEFAPRLDAFAQRNTDVLVMVDDNPRHLFGDNPAAVPIRIVDSGAFLSRCGVAPHETAVLVLDRNLRIALRVSPAPAADVAPVCLRCLDALPSDTPGDVAMPAPLLVLPNLLPPAICRFLIDLFESSPTIDGAVARIDAAGNPGSVVDHQKKHRRDLMIDESSELHHMLRDTLLRRCAPEISRAFHAQVAHTDRILLSRYDDTGGFFRRHRDNAAANIAFREFALSLNLNTGEYDGGHVIFPEYNDHRYRPPAGAGVIFSTALLHEATPVTAGRRYVLLTFFHGDAAEARRLALVQDDPSIPRNVCNAGTTTSGASS
jgi:predicted 2-oxoglutarate/Fe(II)-dependent dioxygenase YbiX